MLIWNVTAEKEITCRQGQTGQLDLQNKAVLYWATALECPVSEAHNFQHVQLWTPIIHPNTHTHNHIVKAASLKYRTAQIDYYNVRELNIFMAHTWNGSVNIYELTILSVRNAHLSINSFQINEKALLYKNSLQLNCDIQYRYMHISSLTLCLDKYWTAFWNVVRICWSKRYYRWDVLWHAVKCYGVNSPFPGEEDQKITKRPARMLRQRAWVIDTHGYLQNKSQVTNKCHNTKPYSDGKPVRLMCNIHAENTVMSVNI